MGTAAYWGLAIVALGFLIVVHEAGHYFVARWCKMRVERFSIGFGPPILKRRSKKTGTLFQITPFPFGGFAEIRGMNIAEEVDPDDKHAYANRPAWQRFITIFAGPATNYLSAIVLAFALYACYGQRSYEQYWVVDTVENKTFDAATKLASGDRILAVNGADVWARSPKGEEKGVSDIVKASGGKPITLHVRRDGKEMDVTIQPTPATPFLSIPIPEVSTPRLGISIAIETDRVEVGILDAAGKALVYPIDQTKAILGGLKEVVTGEQPLDPGGAVRITAEFKKAFKAGWVYGIELLMVLSVYIGMFNLFPLPALDGGRLVFLIYEMVTRRRANPRIESTVHMVGILLLLVIMVLVTFRDCRGLIMGT
jgi:regulator of sigma E protease